MCESSASALCYFGHFDLYERIVLEQREKFGLGYSIEHALGLGFGRGSSLDAQED